MANNRKIKTHKIPVVNITDSELDLAKGVMRVQQNHVNQLESLLMKAGDAVDHYAHQAVWFFFLGIGLGSFTTLMVFVIGKR